MSVSTPTPAIARLEELLLTRILVLDGAMGTMIQAHQLEERDFRGTQFANHPKELRGCNDLLSLTRPDIIEDIHRQYFEAGADIVETNTFNSTSISMAEYQLESAVTAINRASAQIARRVADEFTERNPDKPRFVAGSIGPTSRAASLSPDVNDPGFRAVTFDQLVASYREQIEALCDGGVDILFPETTFDTLNLKACLFAISQVFDDRGITLPVMISATITDASGRTLSGQTVEAFWNSVAHFPALSVGLNCALGADRMRPYVEELARIAPCFLSCHPNAGLPNEFGGVRRDARIHGATVVGVRRKRLAQHRRRLLRHDARAHPRDRRRRARLAAAQAAARRRTTRGSAGWSRSRCGPTAIS